MSFPKVDSPLRTDHSFRHRLQAEHHSISRSPIELLPIDMIADFSTSDPLHLLELGIMKKCLLRWRDGSKTYKHRFTEETKKKVNQMLVQANADKPFEIHRSIRSLDCLE